MISTSVTPFRWVHSGEAWASFIVVGSGGRKLARPSGKTNATCIAMMSPDRKEVKLVAIESTTHRETIVVSCFPRPCLRFPESTVGPLLVRPDMTVACLPVKDFSSCYWSPLNVCCECSCCFCSDGFSFSPGSFRIIESLSFCSSRFSG